MTRAEIEQEISDLEILFTTMQHRFAELQTLLRKSEHPEDSVPRAEPDMSMDGNVPRLG